MELRRLLATLFLFSPLVACNEGTTAPPPPGVLKQIHPQLKKLSGPVQCSEFPALAGDPSVLKDGDTYRIYYTGLDKDIKGGGIGSATSQDGENWTIVAAGDAKTGQGIVLRGRSKTWEHQLETANVIKHGDTYFLYYCGYPEEGWPKNPGQIGVATSKDGIHFTRPQTQPILPVSKDGYDKNGLYSPSVIHDGKQFVMVYAGHCYPPSSKVTPGFYILGATSPDGIKWTKNPKPVLAADPRHDFMKWGVAEPAITRAPDGNYYLFFTGNLGDDPPEKRVIAIARGKTPFGPWEINPKPVISPSDDLYDKNGVLAPSVLFENNKLRVWYLTSDGDMHMTGYAELPWPLPGW